MRKTVAIVLLLYSIAVTSSQVSAGKRDRRHPTAIPTPTFIPTSTPLPPTFTPTPTTEVVKITAIPTPTKTPTPTKKPVPIVQSTRGTSGKDLAIGLLIIIALIYIADQAKAGFLVRTQKNLEKWLKKYS